MGPTAVYNALSTIAQCAAVLAALIGFLGWPVGKHVRCSALIGANQELEGLEKHQQSRGRLAS